MRAAGILEPGGVVTALIQPMPRSLRADEVRIEIQAAGVGNWDELMRLDRWPSGLTSPHALGVEAAGVIAATGRDVRNFAVGDAVLTHVFPFRDGGAWAQQLLAPTDYVARKPDTIPWAQAACLPVPGLTAWQALHQAGSVSPRQRVFVHGAGGVTGGLLVQLAVLSGAEVVATSGADSMKRVRGFGAVHVVDRRSVAWQQEVGDALRGAADVAINATPEAASAALSMVEDGGRFVTISGHAPPSERGIAVHGLVVRADGGQLARLARMLAARDIELSVRAVHPLADAAQALEEVVEGTSGGAVALTV